MRFIMAADWIVALLGVFGLAQASLDRHSPRTSEEPAGLVVIGTGQSGDPCSVEVNAAVLPELETMGIHAWIDACREADRPTDMLDPE